MQIAMAYSGNKRTTVILSETPWEAQAIRELTKKNTKLEAISGPDEYHDLPYLKIIHERT